MVTEKHIAAEKVKKLSHKDVEKLFDNIDLFNAPFMSDVKKAVDLHMKTSKTQFTRHFRTRFMRRFRFTVKKINSTPTHTEKELKPGIVSHMLKLHLLILSDLYDVLDIINTDETPFILEALYDYAVGKVGERLCVQTDGKTRLRTTHIPAVTLASLLLPPFVVGHSSSLERSNSIFRHLFTPGVIAGETSFLEYFHDIVDKKKLLSVELPDTSPPITLFGEVRRVLKILGVEVTKDGPPASDIPSTHAFPDMNDADALPPSDEPLSSDANLDDVGAPDMDIGRDEISDIPVFELPESPPLVLEDNQCTPDDDILEHVSHNTRSKTSQKVDSDLPLESPSKKPRLAEEKNTPKKNEKKISRVRRTKLEREALLKKIEQYLEVKATKERKAKLREVFSTCVSSHTYSRMVGNAPTLSEDDMKEALVLLKYTSLAVAKKIQEAVKLDRPSPVEGGVFRYGTNTAATEGFICKNSKAWCREDVFITWLIYCVLPRKKEGKNLLVILDNFSVHCGPFVQAFCYMNGIDLFYLYPNSTSKTQPLDIAFNDVYKRLAKDLHEEYQNHADYRGQFFDQTSNALFVAREAMKRISREYMAKGFRNLLYFGHLSRSERDALKTDPYYKLMFVTTAAGSYETENKE